ncbi:MAG TPA: hypothetical protein VF172_02315 [Nitrososphaera sp.]
MSGARGVLQKIDTAEKTITLVKHSGSEDYQCADLGFEPEKWQMLIGKMVDVQLCDFLVVDVSVHSEQQKESTNRGDE